MLSRVKPNLLPSKVIFSIPTCGVLALQHRTVGIQLSKLSLILPPQSPVSAFARYYKYKRRVQPNSPQLLNIYRILPKPSNNRPSISFDVFNSLICPSSPACTIRGQGRKVKILQEKVGTQQLGFSFPAMKEWH